FLAHRKDLNITMENVEKIMKAGANCVKIEGIDGSEKTFKHIIESGIPIMGHLGLTPQSMHQLGGFKVQGKTNEVAEKIINQAKKIEEVGCFALVLECVPEELGKKITESISIPTIGIGAGRYTSGQVLVLQDMLGMNNKFSPKFLKKYMNGFELITDALNKFNSEVKEGKFPTTEHCY
ncbi:3-methyl-2-oxobutanoate hydroxymethyltransferase, partial [Pseudomonadota bacterium]